MYHFIVRQWQDEVLTVGIELAEGQLVLVEFPIQRIGLCIVQGVVHPAHVPFHGEAETAAIGRT